ncbi:MAG: hypothetical protein WC097_01625 [Eubacteriales bacterium]
MEKRITLNYKIGDIVWYSSDHYIAKATVVSRHVSYREWKDKSTGVVSEVIEVKYGFYYGNTSHTADGRSFYKTREEAFAATAKNIRIEE